MFSESPLEHIETWIFDINGTLIFNPFYYLKSAFGSIFLNMGLEIPPDKILKQIWFSNQRNGVIESLDINPDRFWSLFNKASNDIWSLENSSQPYEDTKVLDDLVSNGKQIAAFTNAPYYRAIVEANLASQNFNGNILSAFDYGALKPKPDGLFYLMKKLGAEKDTTVYVGNGDEDIQCGKAVGITTVRVYRGEHPITRCGEDFTIETLYDLKKLSGF